jgi:glycosyltransferase involved in cell wall biosynthesis
MKVLHLADSLNRGGSETLLLDICRNANASSLDLIMVATGGGELENEFKESGVEFIRWQRKRPVDYDIVRKLHELLEARNIDIVHSHQAVEALHAVLASHKTSARNVLSFHCGQTDLKNRLALRFVVPRVQARIAVSSSLLSCLQHTGYLAKNKFHVIRNGIDLRRLTPTGENFRQEFGIPSDRFLAGMVGNFYPDNPKDQLTICRALPTVFKQVANAHFVFVGSHSAAKSSHFDECVGYCREQGIAERVHFVGGRADISDVLAALDLFVFSSHSEAFGIAAVEAMLAGVPVVASDIAALEEVSNGGRYAEHFRTGDVNDLAKVLIRLVNHPAERMQLAARARERATRDFSIESHIAKLKELYASLPARSSTNH